VGTIDNDDDDGDNGSAPAASVALAAAEAVAVALAAAIAAAATADDSAVEKIADNLALNLFTSCSTILFARCSRVRCCPRGSTAFTEEEDEEDMFCVVTRAAARVARQRNAWATAKEARSSSAQSKVSRLTPW
jgi:hypothetical protein